MILVHVIINLMKQFWSREVWDLIYIISNNSYYIDRDVKMNCLCNCEVCAFDVHRASYVKHLRSKKTPRICKTEWNDYTRTLIWRTCWEFKQTYIFLNNINN